MEPDGKMNSPAGADLQGLDRFAARKVAVEKLREIGALVEEKPYENNIGFSQRADVPIEPRLSEQWFLKYPSVEPSKACVAEGRMKFYPDRWAKVYDHWLTNIQDWCISRQLWWGHQVPVWRYSFNTREEFQRVKQAYDYILVEQCDRSDIKVQVKGALEFQEARTADKIRSLRDETGLSTEDTIKEYFRRKTVVTAEARSKSASGLSP